MLIREKDAHILLKRRLLIGLNRRLFTENHCFQPLKQPRLFSAINRLISPLLHIFGLCCLG